jgi:hypothetical protein
VAVALRTISFDDLRDALEYLVTLEVSDAELVERGIPLREKNALFNGLGPSSFALVESVSGRQYLLERLEYKPDVVNIHGPLSSDEPQPLIDELLAALDVSREKVRWSASEDFWNESRQSYDRNDWLRRVKRHS